LKALAGPLAISDVAVTRSTTSGSLVHVDATVSGPEVAGVADVLVSYTASGSNTLSGKWASCNLAPGRSGTGGITPSCINAQAISVFGDEITFVRHFTADIDTAGTGAAQTDLRVLIQAVSGTGLVSIAVNNGQYYQVKDAPVINSPKKTTTLTLGPVTSPSPYDHAATFSATVTASSGTVTGDVVFSVGSQRKSVPVGNGGVATTTMVIQELPGNAGGDSRNYPLTAAFVETPTLLPSSASADFVVSKETTNLAFGPTPFLVALTDNITPTPHKLRDETIFFDVSDPVSGSVLQTLSVQTGVDGVAQLRGLTVPPGTYNLTAYFLGKVPHSTGAFGTVVDDRYAPSSISTRIVFAPTPPACDLTNAGIDPVTQQRFIEVTVQDPSSGLVSVSTTELVNATVSLPDFVNGVQTPLIVRAIKIDQTLPSQLGLEVVNAAGSVTFCDPVAVVVGGRGEPKSATVTNIKPQEHFVVIYNGKPGIRTLHVKVNHLTWQVRQLRPGEVRTLDIARALNPKGPNTVTVTAEGPPNGSAMVLISDMAPASAKARHAQPERSDPYEDVNSEDNKGQGGGGNQNDGR
jgi:hypothetical protein